MKSKKLGQNTSKVEILNISAFGFWIFTQQEELFLSFKDFPWFKQEKIEDIFNVKCVHDDHLYWPQLDIDLSLKLRHCYRVVTSP